jgi:hypothetical protein
MKTCRICNQTKPADFRALLAAHHAMPVESCALVDWWQGESND